MNLPRNLEQESFFWNMRKGCCHTAREYDLDKAETRRESFAGEQVSSDHAKKMSYHIGKNDRTMQTVSRC